MDIYRINEANYRKAVSWSKNADGRASIVLAFNGALIALVVTDNPYTHGFVTSFHMVRQEALDNWVGVAIFVLFIVAFTLSVAYAFGVLMLDARKTSCRHNRAFSFMNITDMSREEYRAALSTMDNKEILHALQDQTYIAAQLARAKITRLAMAWRLLAFAMMSAVMFIVYTVFVANAVSQSLH